MPQGPLPYPTAARSERMVDGAVHALGVAFALGGATGLIVTGLLYLDGARAAAVAVYGLALVATFTASACYHLMPWDHVRPTLRRLDHAAIFLKIAGTCTPMAALVGTAFAWTVLAAVWALALLGAAAKLLFWHEPGRLGLVAYLVLGWLGVLLLWPLADRLPGSALGLAAAGGLLYTFGVVFFAWESLRFSTAIWHGFVLAASGCFFAAIAMGSFAA